MMVAANGVGDVDLSLIPSDVSNADLSLEFLGAKSNYAPGFTFDTLLDTVDSMFGTHFSAPDPNVALATIETVHPPVPSDSSLVSADPWAAVNETAIANALNLNKAGSAGMVAAGNASIAAGNAATSNFSELAVLGIVAVVGIWLYRRNN